MLPDGFVSIRDKTEDNSDRQQHQNDDAHPSRYKGWLGVGDPVEFGDVEKKDDEEDSGGGCETDAFSKQKSREGREQQVPDEVVDGEAAVLCCGKCKDRQQYSHKGGAEELKRHTSPEQEGETEVDGADEQGRGDKKPRSLFKTPKCGDKHNGKSVDSEGKKDKHTQAQALHEVGVAIIRGDEAIREAEQERNCILRKIGHL